MNLKKFIIYFTLNNTFLDGKVPTMGSFINRVYTEPENMIYNALPRVLNPGYTFDLHCHRNVEICLMTEGECDIVVNGEKVTVHSGEIMALFPQALHSFHVNAARPAKFLQVHFSPECWRSEEAKIRGDIKMLAWFFDEHSDYLLYPFSPQLRACVENICREKNNENEALSNELARLYLSELVLLLSREISQSYRHVFNIRDPLLIQAVQYVNEHISQRITVTDLALTCRVPERQISQMFKNTFRMTLSEYINVAKVEKAMYYLTDSELSVGQISERLGFSSTQYFSTVFKQVTRVTPKEYRNMAQKDV